MTLGDRVAVLDHGRLQQVAPPQELYERPANTFVAGFIGNPPMNLFSARLNAASGGGLQLRLGEQTAPLALPATSAEGWRVWLDAPLTFGIRPEHLRLAEDCEESVRTTVSDAEYLGHETLLHVRVDGLDPAGSALVARLPGIRPFHKGEPVRLSLDSARLHGFGSDGVALAGLG
jgi:ABC-type sugar transport system ATPase subunit